MAESGVSRPDEDLYTLWFGCDDTSFQENWKREDAAEYTIGRVKQIPEARTATHVRTFGQIPPDIHLLFPQVTHLNIEGPQLSSLQK
ncbi:hypothetical protein EB796_002988 [Bugula neritina]|uniref:Uncharacterized protein n=1 Tax=Bugula neritina TaxID=10212 RepID=A0A7J7KLQ0_BUGNE|nr:hypothetical protein EB796_002988 [Bugula neritina]